MLQDREAELAILGMAMIDSQAAQKLVALPQDVFADPETRALFLGIKRVVENHGNPDLITVADSCRRLEVDPGESLLIAMRNAVTAANYGQYETILMDLRKRRVLLRACSELVNHIADTGADADALAANVQDAIRGSGEKPSSLPMDEALQRLLERVEKGASDGISTGVAGLDRAIGGFRPKQLVVLGARPGVGKTALAINIATYVAEKSGSVLVVSLEMDSQEILARVMARETGLDVQAIESGKLNENDWSKFAEKLGPLSKLPLRFAEGAKTPLQIRREAQAMIRDGGLRLIVIDYIQLMHADGKTGSRYEEITQISRELKLMAMELNVTVLALTQFNRESEAKGGLKKRKPSMAEAKDSGSIEQDANIFLTLYPPPEPKEGTPDYRFWELCQSNGTEWQLLCIDKNRQGRTGAVDLEFDKAHMEFNTLINMEE